MPINVFNPLNSGNTFAAAQSSNINLAVRPRINAVGVAITFNSAPNPVRLAGWLRLYAIASVGQGYSVAQTDVLFASNEAIPIPPLVSGSIVYARFEPVPAMGAYQFGFFFMEAP